MDVTFESLIAGLPGAELIRAPASAIGDVVHDSRDVRPGSCFVCRRGLRVDGHDYVPAALAAGAAAIVAERPIETPAEAGLAIVPDGRVALASLARRFWGEPDRRLGLVGVTGTDGKTSTSRLIAWMLGAYVPGVGELTTVNTRAGGADLKKTGRLTTPEAPTVARLLARMVQGGDAWAVVEVASHALELARVDGFAFDRAVITNVTHEHLDLHGSLEAYRAAKRRLLDLLAQGPDDGRGKAAVLNADDPVTAGFADGCPVDVVSFGQANPADVSARCAGVTPDGLVIAGHSPWGSWEASTRLRGRWNVANVSAAVACLGSITGDVSAGVERLSSFAPVKGRMETIDVGQPFRVIVDFAHTPAALAACLAEVRTHTSGRVLAVFGSAGDQDEEKRPMLGRAAGEGADVAIVTNEDPRREDPGDIARAVIAGSTGGGARFETIHDRREAIARAFKLARAGDTVVLAGKGHEQSIQFADREAPWDEATAAREALAGLGYGGG
ncbi:MAG: UDP-N-acetylmuramoyl-L-alanyl-D-glutamate--2,6-diaminopimelate ligase [Chloroflexota bacterium]|nr:UDP-N-acetylmuramoyl-L-alanyl-D-glutamate--2,6-diaminopimelate ligase [Chloroflexota bacterium]